MEQVRVVGCLAAHRGEQAQACGPGGGIVPIQGTPAVFRPAVGKKADFIHRGLHLSFSPKKRGDRIIMQLLVMLETWEETMQRGSSVLGADQPLNGEPARSCAGLPRAQPHAGVRGCC